MSSSSASLISTGGGVFPRTAKSVTISPEVRVALDMDPAERNARMQRMRRVVKEHNIYRWAANLIGELSEIRIEKAHPGLAVTRTGGITAQTRHKTEASV